MIYDVSNEAKCNNQKELDDLTTFFNTLVLSAEVMVL